MKKVLITAFEPFLDVATNSSYEALKAVPELIDDKQVIKEGLPVSYRRTPEELKQLIEKHRPDVVISLGQAAGRTKVNLERVAVNLMDANAADNDGLVLHDAVIAQDGPVGYFTKLPVRKMYDHAQELDLPIDFSLSAGGYICNLTMYTILALCETEYPDMIGGFIHVPLYDGQVEDTSKPSLPLNVITQCIMEMIRCL
ncbi:MAG TPA: pyroglutamyl-peptidase I [Firmicutes bacterium]|nr:pyroglutamyl-peptidase I [Bacillota bacterium]